MNTPEKLLTRLDTIGNALAKTGKGLALLALGSVGNETERLDAYSDLDIFAIVQDGYKEEFLNDLGWLAMVAPIGFAFQNTADGYKLLFADGIFCEYAIFTLKELQAATAPAGRVVWAAEGLDVAQLQPKPKPATGARESDPAWQVGEALTNLYIGMGRYRRGEKLSAMFFVQNYALSRVIELVRMVESPVSGLPDEFDSVRRIEQRYPQVTPRWSEFATGYENTPQAAAAILAFLEANFEVNPVMSGMIKPLLKEGKS